MAWHNRHLGGAGSIIFAYKGWKDQKKKEEQEKWEREVKVGVDLVCIGFLWSRNKNKIEAYTDMKVKNYTDRDIYIHSIYVKCNGISFNTYGVKVLAPSKSYFSVGELSKNTQIELSSGEMYSSIKHREDLIKYEEKGKESISELEYFFNFIVNGANGLFNHLQKMNESLNKLLPLTSPNNSYFNCDVELLLSYDGKSYFCSTQKNTDMITTTGYQAELDSKKK